LRDYTFYYEYKEIKEIERLFEDKKRMNEKYGPPKENVLPLKHNKPL